MYNSPRVRANIPHVDSKSIVVGQRTEATPREIWRSPHVSASPFSTRWTTVRAKQCIDFIGLHHHSMANSRFDACANQEPSVVSRAQSRAHEPPFPPSAEATITAAFVADGIGIISSSPSPCRHASYNRFRLSCPSCPLPCFLLSSPFPFWTRRSISSSFDRSPSSPRHNRRKLERRQKCRLRPPRLVKFYQPFYFSLRRHA